MSGIDGSNFSPLNTYKLPWPAKHGRRIHLGEDFRKPPQLLWRSRVHEHRRMIQNKKQHRPAKKDICAYENNYRNWWNIMWRTLSLIVKSICSNLSRWKIYIRKTVLVYNKTKRTYSKKMHSVAIYTATWPCQNWFLFQNRKKNTI